MLSLLKPLVSTKLGLLVAAVLALGTAGTAFALTGGQGPIGQLAGSLAGGNASATHTTHTTGDSQDKNDKGSKNDQNDQNDEGHQDGAHLSVEGTLLSYDAGAKTIRVKSDEGTVTISVNGSTKVNGKHATSLTDLTAAMGHKVQVQATKQSNGTFLADKVTVPGAEPGDHGGDHGQSGTHSKS